MSTLSLLIFAAIGAVLGYIQAEWNDSPAGQKANAEKREKERQKKAWRKVCQGARDEAFRKYPGGHNHSKREEYVSKLLNE